MEMVQRGFRLTVCTLTLSILVGVTTTVRGDTEPSQLQATVSQRVTPVLIRNDENPLLQLTINAKSPDVMVQAITVSLEGTDDPADIDALSFYFSGDKGKFSTQARFGDSQQPGQGSTLVFKGHARLKAGANYFWLSCRLKPGADLGHQVDATCLKIQTSAGAITPVDETDGLRKRIGIALRRHFDDGVHTYRIPALATTPRGTLLCVYDMRRRKSRDLQEDIDIGLLRSTDGGNTWEAQQVIMDMGTHSGKPQELNGCSDPGIIVDAETGKIFCFAVWMQDKPGKHQWQADGSEPGLEIGKSAQFLMVTSDDDGLTWSKPKNMTRAWKKPEWILYAPSPQQGITLKDGTLAMPTQGRDEQDRTFSNLLISKDHGAHWSVSPIASLGNNECQAVQLGDGTLMMNMRTGRLDQIPHRRH